ncbi:SAM-dependent methyltransferase [Alcanivorax sp. JB21]|uniref:tRNA (guanine(46)-N(7))-methyltransferase TrmB n=1 Tax=Alcanivorax limicola TaxID=2874102 RepID=UPI001CBC5452|nr:methyltransferase domain-containing protein [Alcanivorax limicola]MBZ2187801.1 SAM-dependent methyltransferase [Alcanivorax limicola]
MFGNSKPVVSNQTGIHQDLFRTVQRHLTRTWQAPVAEHTRAAFAEALAWLAERQDAPVILDSGCGTARSSRWLAAQHPGAAVIGIDQSAHRLARGRDAGALPDNLLLLRAECADFWRLAEEGGWRLMAHYLLYPNPWPKAAHLKRRWHGHPVFPSLLNLGGTLEVRSNWPIYLQEMQAALGQAAIPSTLDELPADAGEAVTDFELKYLHSGHALWRLQAQLP